MLFDRSSRFKGIDQPSSPAMTYQNFSEYLRQQFLNSKNMFNPHNQGTHSKKDGGSDAGGPETGKTYNKHIQIMRSC